MLNKLGVCPSSQNSANFLHLYHSKEHLWHWLLLLFALLAFFGKRVKINISKILKLINLPEKEGYCLTLSRNGYSRKKLKRIKPIGNFAFKKGFYKRGAPTPWNYKILRRDKQREREVRTWDFKAEPKYLANKRKHFKAFCEYFGPDPLWVQIGLIPLNLVELYYLQQLSVSPSGPFAVIE